jgi:hypothetical protein
LAPGFVCREPSVALYGDQLPRALPLRKWNTLSCVECRMVRHLSSRNRARNASLWTARAGHRISQFPGILYMLGESIEKKHHRVRNFSPRGHWKMCGNTATQRIPLAGTLVRGATKASAPPTKPPAPTTKILSLISTGISPIHKHSQERFHHANFIQATNNQCTANRGRCVCSKPHRR